MRFNRFLMGVLLAGALVGCADEDLEVTNPNNPDRQRVLRNPADVESLASSQFQSIIAGTIGNIARLQTSMSVMGLENAATGLANNGMPRGQIPRQPIDNGRGNPYQPENYNDFRLLSFAARNSADALREAKKSSFSLGANRDGDLLRLKSVAHFFAGVAMGYVSLVYDSAGVPRETDGLSDIPPLEGYKAVNAFALAQFDSALAYAGQTGMTAIPGTWILGFGATGNLAVADYIKIVRSFKAKMRANVARDGTERAAVNWDAVIADATAGITSDMVLKMNSTNGWDYNWLATTLHFRDANWHQMTPYIIGMADVSGEFEKWLQVPRNSRDDFLIITPDLRFPQGATRAAQNADRGGQGAPTGRKYFRNRTESLDNNSPGWTNSQYDHYRFRAFADANRIGDLPFFTVAENDMFAAEGHIRKGNIAAAAALIDKTRVTAGLPALSGVVTTATEPVPGGANCVPRIPVGPTFTTTACGNIFEAMKWEKRMETAYTTYGAWYFDGRGWNDLPIGTALEFPVPNQEADARLIAIYNLGGIGGPRASLGSTYGYGAGDTR